MTGLRMLYAESMCVETLDGEISWQLSLSLASEHLSGVCIRTSSWQTGTATGCSRDRRRDNRGGLCE